MRQLSCSLFLDLLFVLDVYSVHSLYLLSQLRESLFTYLFIYHYYCCGNVTLSEDWDHDATELVYSMGQLIALRPAGLLARHTDTPAEIWRKTLDSGCKWSRKV